DCCRRDRTNGRGTIASYETWGRPKRGNWGIQLNPGRRLFTEPDYAFRRYGGPRIGGYKCD
ncbi:hypothetical protein QP246_10040, partial [Aerococcus urinae]|nr:hypothetical protein [Aerococcus urinae]